jgi:hypothetical protein
MAKLKNGYRCFALVLLVLVGFGFAETMVSVDLHDIDSGLTSPAGNYRWLDTADQPYAVSYQNSYDYTQASVHIDYYTNADVLHGTLTGTNMKPNFTYQLKVVASPDGDLATLEGVGLSGRWWQQEWGWSDTYGGIWTNGWNLNNKGDGSSPSPNDNTYFSRRDIVDLASPTRKKYRYTTYRVLDYFITDANGDVTLDFIADSSYHVVFKTAQRTAGSNDGPVKQYTFDADTENPAYDTDYTETTVGVFGEWERLPMGGVFFRPGSYNAEFLLTEESFHGTGPAGGWAAAMSGEATFSLCPHNPVGDLNGDCRVDTHDFAKMAQNWLVDCTENPDDPSCQPQ